MAKNSYLITDQLSKMMQSFRALPSNFLINSMVIFRLHFPISMQLNLMSSYFVISCWKTMLKCLFGIKILFIGFRFVVVSFWEIPRRIWVILFSVEMCVNQSKLYFKDTWKSLFLFFHLWNIGNRFFFQVSVRLGDGSKNEQYIIYPPHEFEWRLELWTRMKFAWINECMSFQFWTL